jgi:deoxyribonuclease IV
MKSSSNLFGYHAPIAGGLSNALIESRKLDCTAVQIFSRNPRGWAARPLDEEEIEKFKWVRAENKIEFVAVHASYLINLAAADDVILEKSRAAFREEIERSIRLGANCLVVHPGSSKGACEADGVRVCAESLRVAVDDVNLDGLQILIENTAGQGECIGYRFEHLRDIIASCPDLNLGVCFDTAHSFASGYELRTKDGFSETLAALDKCVGTQKVRVVHFNDSKTKFASRVDRHAHVGAGEIGREGMRRVAQATEFSRAAFLLETPQDEKEDTARNVAALRSLLANEES